MHCVLPKLHMIDAFWQPNKSRLGGGANTTYDVKGADEDSGQRLKGKGKGPRAKGKRQRTNNDKLDGAHLLAWHCKAGFFQHRPIEDLHIKEVHLPVCRHNLPSRVHNHMAVLQALGIRAAVLLKAP